MPTLRVYPPTVLRCLRGLLWDPPISLASLLGMCRMHLARVAGLGSETVLNLTKGSLRQH